MRRKTARKIRPHLAALRRHARAVVGDSDAVSRTLDAVRDADYRVLADRDVRVRLFRDFHDVAIDLAAHADRHALLLRHVQGFSVQEVAAILRSDVLELQARLEAAYAALHGAAGRDVLLIQDDPVLANGMTDMIESLGHRVLGVARNAEEAVNAAQSIRLDAVVVDMAGPSDEQTGAPMMRLLGKIKAPIVFVTPDVDTGNDGRDFVVGTPFHAAELKVVLSQALRGAAGERGGIQ